MLLGGVEAMRCDLSIEPFKSFKKLICKERV